MGSRDLLRLKLYDFAIYLDRKQVGHMPLPPRLASVHLSECNTPLLDQWESTFACIFGCIISDIWHMLQVQKSQLGKRVSKSGASMPERDLALGIRDSKDVDMALMYVLTSLSAMARDCS